MAVMMKVEGVKRFFSKKAGKIYNYHRASGTRLVSQYGTAEFAVELARIDKAWKAKHTTSLSKGTLGHLIQEYRKAPEFLRLKPVTKSDYERVLLSLEPIKAMPLSKIDRPFVVTLRNKAFAKHKRRFANYVVQVLSRVFGVGIDLGLMETNPASKINKVLKATGEGNRNRPWTLAEREAVLAAAPPQLRAPLAFMRYLGTRLGDVRNMKNEAYRDGLITFVTSKGDVEVTVPCPPELAKILDARLRHDVYLFRSSEGQWTEGGWNASWRKLRSRLEAEGKVRPGLTAHGLRHSVATDLREIGCTDREIADILGQRTTYATPTYHRQADMKKSNARVMGKLHLGEPVIPSVEGP